MSTTPSNITDPEHWAEWFEKCALALCCDDTRQALGVFAHKRYERYFRIALRERNRAGGELPIDVRDLLHSPQPGACWLDLEASYWYQLKPQVNANQSTGNLPEAKSYKKFFSEVASLVTPPEESRNYLEGVTTNNLIRTRCRSIVTRSLFRYGGGEDKSGKTQEESIIENHQEVPHSEPILLTSEVVEISDEIFASLKSEDRILVLANANNVSLASPEITTRLGLKKSTLYDRQKVAERSIAPLLRKHQLDPKEHTLVLRRLLELLTEWSLSPECGIGDCLTRGEANT